MKHPPAAHPRRPAAIGRRVPRSRTEAAVELVRVEFRRASLERTLAECRRRQAQAHDDLALAARRAAQLLDRLDPGGDPR